MTMRVGGRGARSQPSVKGRVHATEAAGVWLVTVALKRRHYFVRDIALSRDQIAVTKLLHKWFLFLWKTANAKHAG